jgi:hypothetical protein
MKALHNFLKFICIPLLIYFLIFFLYAPKYIVDPANTYQNPGYDQDGSSFIKASRLENAENNLFDRHAPNIAYPYGWSMMYIPYDSIIDYLVVYPAQWIHGTTIYFWHNIGIIFVYLAGPLFAFWLIYYLSKNLLGSLIGGYIYGFTRLNLWYGGGNDPLVHFEFIPLFFLSFFYYLKKPNKRRLTIVILVSALNTAISMYWGWFIYLSVAILVLSDLIIFKKYFLSIKQALIKFFVPFMLLSIFVSVLINFNFFYYTIKFINPDEIKAIKRTVSIKTFTPDAIERYFLPLQDSLWAHTNNPLDTNKEYIPFSIIALLLILLININKLKKYQRYIIFISVILIIFYIAISSTWLQYPLRKIMPPVTAYSRTSIFLTLFLGIITAIFYGYLSTKKGIIKYILMAVITGVILIDTISPKAFYVTNLKSDVPPMVYDLANKKVNNFSIIHFPSSCGDYGFENQLFQTIHKFPIVNPYYLPVDLKTTDICNELRNPYSENTKNYIQSLNVKYIIIYKDFIKDFNAKKFENNLGSCIQSKETYNLKTQHSHAFHNFFNATLYEVKDSCLKRNLIATEEISNKYPLQVVKNGEEMTAIANYLNTEEKEKLLFEQYTLPDTISQDISNEFKPAAFDYKKISKTEYNIHIKSKVEAVQYFYLNTPLMQKKGWKVYKVDSLDDKLSFKDIIFKETVPAKFFETNLYQTSLATDSLWEGEYYKIVFTPQIIDNFLRKISQFFLITVLLSLIAVLVAEVYNQKKSK